MESIVAGLLANYGPTTAGLGIIALVVVGLIRGWIVPRRTAQNNEQIYKDRIVELAAERDGWHKAHDTSEATRGLMATQLEKLITTQAQNNQLLDLLLRQAGVGRDES